MNTTNHIDESRPVADNAPGERTMSGHDRTFDPWPEPSDDGVVGDCLDCGKGVVCDEPGGFRCTFCDASIHWRGSRTAERPTPKYANRGGEVWEQTDTGERELFAADIVKRLGDLERQLAEAREERDRLAERVGVLQERNVDLERQLDVVSKHRDTVNRRANRIAAEVLAITEQRDRLAGVIRAATVLIAAKGRHNTMLAYEGLRTALATVKETP